MRLFISHATKDAGAEALALARALEAQGHACWIAPRDVRPGIPYPRQIVEAVEACSGLVLLLSPAANESADVLQEVQLAASGKKTIAPVVLRRTEPGPDLRYYVSVRHQIAWSGPEVAARALSATFAPAEDRGSLDPAATTAPARAPSKSHRLPAGLSRWGIAAGAVLLALTAIVIWLPQRSIEPSAPATRSAAPVYDAEMETYGPSAKQKTTGAAAVSYRDGQTFRDCNYCPEMIAIPGGAFMMGSPESEPGRNNDEGPQRRVTIGRFAVGKYEVTFDEWAACAARRGCASNPNPSDSGWGRGRRPVINVTWEDAQEYVGWLSRETGQSYRLSTEAEWEYAARGGTTTRWSWGGEVGAACRHANLWDRAADARSAAACSDGVGLQSAPVGAYRPNAFGLYDMHGNVWEWVEDCYVTSYAGLANDGAAFAARCGDARVLRGGSFEYLPDALRSANRDQNLSADTNRDEGLRVARSL